MYAKCLEIRCCKTIETKLEETQGGFRPGRSTTDQIFSLQQIFDRSWEYTKDIYTCLSTDRKHTTGSSWKALGSVAGVLCYGHPVTGRQVTAFVLRSLCPCRRIKSQLLTLGLPPGYVLSPLLFIVCMNWIDSNSQDKRVSPRDGNCRMNCLLFADDY